MTYITRDGFVMNIAGGPKGLQIYSRSHRRQRAFFYGCPRSRVGRCTNTLEVRMETADRAALAMMTDDVLASEVVTSALDKLMAKFAGAEEDADARRVRITATLKTVGKELTNLQAAVARDGAADTLLAGIRERERTQHGLQAELAALDAAPILLAETQALRRDALRLLDVWRGLLGQHVSTSRQLLRKLLREQRFVFYPKRRGKSQWYELGVRPTLDGFWERLPMLKKAVASPTGSAEDCTIETRGRIAA
jgi:hypothetical protein